ncbi:MAG: hypothetical protein QOJ37_3636 [Pseudonocardiales bacterium]|nr:hypothetical protein [Pseudonocardiales bacterium]
MRALVAPAPGHLALAEVPAPVVGPGRVLVRSRVTAVSAGTELRMLYQGRTPHGPDPAWPAVGAFGYPAAGDVIAVGPNASDVHVGDRVTCGTTWGAHREVLDVDASFVQALPAEVTYLDGACAYWAVPPLCGILAGQPRFNDDVAVVGLGPLGLSAVQMLVPFCRRVVAIDLIGSRCELAEHFGAIAIDGSRTDVTAALRRLLPDGPNVAIQAAGTQAALELALSIVAPRGVVANVGTLPPLTDFDLFWPMQVSGARLVPIHRPAGRDAAELGTSLRQKYLPEVLDLMTRGRLDISSLCTWALPIELAPRAMPFLRDHPESVLGLAFAWDEHDAFGVESFEAAVREAAST